MATYELQTFNGMAWSNDCFGQGDPSVPNFDDAEEAAEAAEKFLRESAVEGKTRGVIRVVSVETGEVMREVATYELIGTPRIESEYSDEYETVMVIDLRRSDGETGDVWICAGVPRSDRGTSD